MSDDVVQEKDKRIAELEEALIFYANPQNHTTNLNYSQVEMDCGNIARKALAQKGGE